MGCLVNENLLGFRPLNWFHQQILKPLDRDEQIMFFLYAWIAEIYGMTIHHRCSLLAKGS